MAELAAAALRLAHGDQPLGVRVEPEPVAAARPEDGAVRLFIDAGRARGVRPGDIVGAIANEADVPGEAIGAIDVHDRFTFVGSARGVPRSRAGPHGARADPQPARACHGRDAADGRRAGAAPRATVNGTPAVGPSVTRLTARSVRPSGPGCERRTPGMRRRSV
ncbi:MAG TPA: DbpA RNA binding domain-containing protein [Candidatus Tectomicrobia bacterium]|nr:DbpA RNA binding domain-containing protein [Candidatus Tectomicrobia bacterium]